MTINNLVNRGGFTRIQLILQKQQQSDSIIITHGCATYEHLQYFNLNSYLPIPFIVHT